MRNLTRLDLRGFKSIRHINVELRDLNILLGANGAGKSNLLSWFRLLNQLISGNLQSEVGREGGANAILHHGSKRTDHLECTMIFEGDRGGCSYQLRLAVAASDTLVFELEQVSFAPRGGTVSQFFPLGKGHRESNLEALIISRSDGYEVATFIKEALTGCRFYHFHDTSSNAPVKQTADLHDNRHLKGHADNLAAFLYMLKKRAPADFDRIEASIRQVAPFFGGFVLEPSNLNPNAILLRWREKGSGSEFGAHQMSDGTLRFACLATLLLQPDEFLPRLIVLDEPELGLHPYALTQLAAMLRAASRRTQLLVSTQSVPLIDQLFETVEELEDVIIVEREDDASVFRRLAPDDLRHWLEDYSPGQLWLKGVLGGSPIS